MRGVGWNVGDINCDGVVVVLKASGANRVERAGAAPPAYMRKASIRVTEIAKPKSLLL